MRLRQIRLAGFKSFVDPTVIDVPGRLVGVVGPNGCGKSNVMDAVRWVLGESKAAELRGESMQDVIFNGAANRRPAGRASVELVFDNSEGRIGGEWGKYAEISVKRILTRDGASNYVINNQQVRRRDVQDIFLGTGLGPRAYAIIGQGMITRIIEARPEELRVFLEEAAGVSKYKERRRETENRLADTRDNLTRVDDILREHDAQIVKLEQQAEVARRYGELKARHDDQQVLLWLTRRREAEAERRRAEADLAERQVALDAHLAELRGTELELERLREANQAAADGVHAAQGELLQVNAEIGKLEAEVRMIADARTRLGAQIEALVQTRARRLAEHDGFVARAAEFVQAIAEGEARGETARERRAAHDETLPALEDGYAGARDALASARAAAAGAEQAIEGAGLEQRTLERQLAALGQRRERLEQERRGLGAPDEQRLANLAAEIAALQDELAATAAALEEGQAAAARLVAERDAAAGAKAGDGDQLARLEARLHALQELQANVEADERLDPWLKRQGLERLPRLLRSLEVDGTWTVAFEAVLHERLEALEVGRLDTVGALASDAPPARVAFYSGAGAAARAESAPEGARPLLAHVRGHDAALHGVLADWLAGTYAADDLAQAIAGRDRLPPGAQFVVPAGHRVSRHAVRFHAADDRKAGLLGRRQEIENLERQLKAQRLAVEQSVAALARAEAALRQAGESAAATRQRLERDRARLHAQQLESVRLNELADRVRHRSGQIATELREIDEHREELQARLAEAEDRFQELDREVAERQEAVERAREAYEAADRAIREARDRARELDAECQRIAFETAAQRDREADVRHAITVAEADASRLGEDIDRAQLDAARLDDSAAREGLDRWLAQRSDAELALREARSRHDELAQRVRGLDERRLARERELAPLQERITECRLKEQAARLAVEQFAESLAAAGADPAALEARDTAGVRAASVQGEITRLAQQIADLGPVNLAALGELETARTRRSYLDAQSTDLQAAITTLEDAIRKIDRETREVLKATFDEVNRHFGTLFPTLFGGGEARLAMTGEEILDAGVQVMAQPPGKRNSSIQLLSGGEKALTATALVFALFRLNPAPFCLLDEVDAPLDEANTERFCALVRTMSAGTQFLFITHNKVAMELAEQLVGVTMQEQGVSRIVAVDIDSALRLTAEAA